MKGQQVYRSEPRARRKSAHVMLILVLISSQLASGQQLPRSSAGPVEVWSTTQMSMLREAADKGDARSQYELGLVYQFGAGVQRDFEQALQWYRKSAAG